MSWNRVLAVLLAASLLLTAVSGCADKPAGDGDEPAGETSDEVTEPAGEWARRLPTQPGTSWDLARYVAAGEVPVQLSVQGPWTLPGGGEGWETVTVEIVDSADVSGTGQFADYDHVVRSVESYGTSYYPRRITDEWMLQLGKITEQEGAEPLVEPYEEPMKLWPVDFEVGDTFVVVDGESFDVNAVVLGKNSVTVPAGTIDEAYLVRFDYVALAEGAPSGSQYYILSPDAGQVAVFMVSTGDEASGFTGLNMASVMVRFPAEQ